MLDPIPSAVAQFLQANIDSVDQLEILRLVSGDLQKQYSSVTLAEELHLPVEVIELHVKALSSRGLLTVVADQPLSCKYGPRSPEIDSQVQMLVKTYLERPVSLIKMVYENLKQLRLFAEAFRLKGGNEHGGRR